MVHPFSSDRGIAPAARAEVTTQVDGSAATDAATGTVRIAPAVLIQLIEMAVADIDGLASLTSHKHGKPADGVQPRGKAFDDGKVRVIVDGDQIDADVAIVMHAGTNISTLTQRIREQVGLAAGRMLGMRVRDVNIFVDDIVFPTA